MDISRQKILVQKTILLAVVLIFILKIVAWQVTKSYLILTDVLESVSNLLASFFSLYSLHISLKPKDINHPYGHGKIEFISSALEGSLILFSGIFILYESVKKLFEPSRIENLDWGMIIVFLSGIFNYFLGLYSLRKGKKNNSLVLISQGNHLFTDTYSVMAMVGGLLIIYLTKIYWLDVLFADLMACLIVVTGFKILRKSIAGIMDEADDELIELTLEALLNHRQTSWIDVYNFRIVNYGGMINIDCNLILPWYYNIKEANYELKEFKQALREIKDKKFEIFIYVENCTDSCCRHCLKDCQVRKSKFVCQEAWTKFTIKRQSSVCHQ